MIDLLREYKKEDLIEIFKGFNKKGDIHTYFGITDNSNGIRYIKSVCDEIGFDLDFYKNKKNKYCLLCGCKLKKGQKKFCSSSHAATYNNQKRVVIHDEKKHTTKNTPKNKERTTKENNKTTYYCIKCGNEIQLKYALKFCSKECEIKFKKEEYYKNFINNSEKYNRGNYIPRSIIREFIMNEQNNKCAIEGCKCEPYHNGKPLVFVLDHIDGDASNNKRENLRMICPNCDSQLDTFKSKNKNSKRRNYWKEHIINNIRNT